MLAFFDWILRDTFIFNYFVLNITVGINNGKLILENDDNLKSNKW